MTHRLPIVRRVTARVAVAALAAAGVAALAFAACGEPGETGQDAAISESCREATTRSDFQFVQDEILTPSCAAFSVCHQGAASQALGLNLEAGNSEINMIGVPSQTDGALNLVEPGDPEASYLMHALGSFGDVELTMPLNNPLLCPEKRGAVERWILSLNP